jgi:pre-mRNA-processing factor 40
MAIIPPPPMVPPQITYTPAQIDAAWKLYKDASSGRSYYANALSQKSQFDMPDCLQKNHAVANNSTPAMVNAGTAAVWKEYQDASTGKTYYSNGTTTTWDKPAELQQQASVSGLETNQDATEGDTTTADHHHHIAKRQRRSTPASSSATATSAAMQFETKDEAIATFKALLLLKDISPSLKWNEVVKLCQTDARWFACETALSTGERKQALAEYQTKRSNELKDMERQERIRAKTVFAQLLSSVVPSLPGFSVWTTRLAQVRDVLTKDERFHVVTDEGTRESLFDDFLEDYRKRQDRRRADQKRAAREDFVGFLTDQQQKEDGALLYSSTWNSFVASLDDDAKDDSRWAVSSDLLSDQDRQLLFADFVIELQRVEDDKRRRIREATRRAEQEQRDALVATLTEMAVKGKLVPASRWRHVEEQIASHPSYGLVKSQNRDGPRDIFENFVTEWNGKYRKERSFLSQIIYPSSKGDEIVQKATTFDEFLTALLDKASELSADAYQETKAIVNEETPVSSARLYFNELSMRAKGVSGPPIVRHGSALRGTDSDSSEDEGEIVEDGITDIINT